MIHIYHGNGKGKTTAAVGLAVRAYGAGLEPVVFQFLKNGSSSEIAVLEKLGIPVSCCTECTKFTFRMNDDEKAAVAERHNIMLAEIKKYISEKRTGPVIMDEFLDAYNSGLIDRKLAEEIITGSDENIEIVLTGRNPADVFLETADYISEISAVRHPYTKGVTARKGIEY